MGKNLKGKELGEGLSQRKDGRYTARFVDCSGKRRQYYSFKLSEVKDWLVKARYEDANNILYKKDKITVNDWFNYFMDTYKKNTVREATFYNYKIRYEKNIKPYIGNLLLSEVRTAFCQNIINNMLEQGYAPGSIDLAKITMQILFDSAISNGYIMTNPINKSIKTIPEEERERRVLTLKEQDIFLEYAKKSGLYIIYAFTLETGLRCGEVCGLRWQDVDFDAACLFVKKNLRKSREKGKGYYLGEPKTKASVRKVPLTDAALRLLKMQKKQQLESKLKHPYDAKKDSYADWDLVFYDYNKKTLANEQRLLTGLSTIVKNINQDRVLNNDPEIFEDVKMHSLRHTFATRCIENGMKPKVLQKILGHNSITVTMDLYVHATDEELFSEMKKMEKKDGVKIVM